MTGREETSAAPALPSVCAGVGLAEGEFIREVLDRVGDKWSVLIIATLHDGPRRYTELHDAVPSISQRMLTRTLMLLRRDGLVTRTAFAEVPPRVEYALTPLGLDLHSISAALVLWARGHHEVIRGHRALFDASLDKPSMAK
ncbi:winged helix-turn-helix transcriptional regulator [Mycobacteroides salmoniphilum]|uniref:winged helix-turn-helix transcriptional regulator n=1 Tax=Mycobacteroides salmoniphilum TaxID=404941 RepID=UPI0010EC9861|nr:putative HTH-type transcriptional regulator YybR [Mycobacteroides salmoniphilum]